MLQFILILLILYVCIAVLIICSMISNLDLESTTLDLDSRVTVLEENGGSDGNSSVAELEVRVETLEGTAADHETRLTTAEADIEGLKLVHLINDVKILKLRFSNCLLYFCSPGNNEQ